MSFSISSPFLEKLYQAVEHVQLAFIAYAQLFRLLLAKEPKRRREK